MKFTKILAVLFVGSFFYLLQSNAQAGEILTDKIKKEIQECADRTRPCVAQCEGLSNRIDQVEKGMFSDDETSPRERCKNVCEKPCEKYKPYLYGEILNQLTK